MRLSELPGISLPGPPLELHAGPTGLQWLQFTAPPYTQLNWTLLPLRPLTKVRSSKNI